MRILHVASEAHPLIKTGGLADVASALPAAQLALGADARLLLPGYPQVLAGLAAAGPLTAIGAPFGPVFGAAQITLRQGTLPNSDLPVLAIDAPWLYKREGNPYIDASGNFWPDNHFRFGLLGWIAAHIASGELLPEWIPDVLHCHDWHSALTPVYLAQHPTLDSRTVFTIHNLAFQGTFPMSKAAELGLDRSLLTPNGLEFHGYLSFMKGGLILSDHVTTVSPTYAREITRPEFGHGLDGLVRARAAHLSGILNGVDVAAWDPVTDPALARPYTNYSSDDLAGKAACRDALLAEFGLQSDPPGAAPTPVLAVVSRLSEQKGLDLLLSAMPRLLARGLRLVLLGSGDAALENGFRQLARNHPGNIGVATGFDEDLAHRIFSGADAIVVPSRFEPCGLTQMYGLRYGTVPIVRRVGGLADTVVDEYDAISPAGEVAAARPTGFVFNDANADALAEAVLRATEAFADRPRWQALMRNGMRQNVSWQAPASEYLRLYESLGAPG